jgi:hypothetical protein
LANDSIFQNKYLDVKDVQLTTAFAFSPILGFGFGLLIGSLWQNKVYFSQIGIFSKRVFTIICVCVRERERERERGNNN